MPEMTVTVRWPDATGQQVLSPSLVVHDHLDAGVDYTVEDFLRRSRTALQLAGDRVRARYGFPCAIAAASLRALEERAAGFSPTDRVTVLDLQPPLPVVATTARPTTPAAHHPGTTS